MSNSFDPDQAQQNIGPGRNPNCLQRLSADSTRRLRVKTGLRMRDKHPKLMN